MAKGTVKLALGENLNIENVSAVKAEFDKKAKEGAKILLESGTISDIDLTGIQLLNYMITQAEKKKVKLQFKLSLDDSLKEILLLCGFTSILQKAFA
ncbi:MAG: STAS domain-containing protein [Bacteroidales bacterium]|nr:STAS domain-containing protein [Bacteroidales bacterium]